MIRYTHALAAVGGCAATVGVVALFLRNSAEPRAGDDQECRPPPAILAKYSSDVKAVTRLDVRGRVTTEHLPAGSAEEAAQVAHRVFAARLEKINSRASTRRQSHASAQQRVEQVEREKELYVQLRSRGSAPQLRPFTIRISGIQERFDNGAPVTVMAGDGMDRWPRQTLVYNEAELFEYSNFDGPGYVRTTPRSPIPEMCQRGYLAHLSLAQVAREWCLVEQAETPAGQRLEFVPKSESAPLGGDYSPAVRVEARLSKEHAWPVYIALYRAEGLDHAYDIEGYGHGPTDDLPWPTRVIRTDYDEWLDPGERVPVFRMVIEYDLVEVNPASFDERLFTDPKFAEPDEELFPAMFAVESVSAG